SRIVRRPQMRGIRHERAIRRTWTGRKLFGHASPGTSVPGLVLFFRPALSTAPPELSTASIGRNGTESADKAAAEADCDRMGARPRLKLCQEMPHVRLDRLL